MPPMIFQYNALDYIIETTPEGRVALHHRPPNQRCAQDSLQPA
jgi:hypothetical protein